MATPQVCIIPGTSAFSEFRRQALASNIGARDVQGQYIHYVDPAGPLDSESLALLMKLLTNGHHEEAREKEDEALRILHVLPRPGTISPWSSKATSIAHVCGLRNVVRRIERGIKITVYLDD